MTIDNPDRIGTIDNIFPDRPEISLGLDFVSCLLSTINNVVTIFFLLRRTPNSLLFQFPKVIFPYKARPDARFALIRPGPNGCDQPIVGGNACVFQIFGLGCTNGVSLIFISLKLAPPSLELAR